MKKKLFAAWGLALIAAISLMYLPLNDVGTLQSQTTTVQTNLSTAVAVDTNIISVASESGFANGEVVYIDREAMRITDIDATGGVRVIRGQIGTQTRTHSAGAVVYEGPPEYFTVNSYGGSCVTTANINLPRINVQTGEIFSCKEGQWQSQRLSAVSAGLGYEEIKDAAYTMVIGDNIINVTGTTAGRTITLPSITNQPGRIVIIKNIDAIANGSALQTVTVQTVNGQFIGGAKVSSATLTTAGSGINLISTGMIGDLTNVGWLTF